MARRGLPYRPSQLYGRTYYGYVLSWLYVLWATVPAQLVCLVEVAELEVVLYPRDASLRLGIDALTATALHLFRVRVRVKDLGVGLGLGLGLGSGLGLGLGSGRVAPSR